jgi:signal transduction histidine kinase
MSPAVLLSHELSLERRSTYDAELLGEVARTVVTAVVQPTERLATGTATGSVDAALRGVSQLPSALAAGFEPRPGRPSVRAPAPFAGRLHDDHLGPVLERAQATGEPQVSPPVRSRDPAVAVEGGTHVLVAVSPVYDGDPDQPPATAAERRERLAGWLVAVLSPSPVLEALLPVGSVAVVTDGEATLTRLPPTPAAPGPALAATAGLPTKTIDVGGRRLAVSAGNPAAVPVGGRTAALAGLGLIAAAAAGLGTWRLAVRDQRRRAAAARLQDQVALIGEVAPVVQRSLDPAEVLPAVAVQLVDRLGLAGVWLSTPGTGADPLRVFGLGAEPDARVEPVVAPPDRVPAGATLCLALQRGGRSVARLQLVAGRELGPDDLRSLRALVELTTAAIVNASLYAAQQDAVRELAELDTLKTVFLSTASHELRTPATTIAGFASLLHTSWEGLSDEQRRTFADRIAANARSLSAVVQDLLDFSLLDRGRLQVTPEPLDLGEAVRVLLDRLAPVLEHHDLAVRAEIGVVVAADRNALDRVVTNLVTNAAKYAPPASTITVEVVSRHEGGEVVVSDQGPGVPPEERDQVFTRFYRGASEAVTSTRGVGIGLAVVAELVDRMQGAVEVDDAPGGGARFTVWLPAVCSHPLDETEGAADATGS